MGNTRLPWVDEWPHLGNSIDRNDFQYPGNCSMKHDLLNKHGTFIGKFHSLFQEFVFLDHGLIMKVVNIYATSFYGSHLWDFSGKEATKLFNSWNFLIRKVHNLPNTTHRYLLETISNAKHLKSTLYSRYLTFIHSLKNSKKDCLSSLVKIMTRDHGSVTSQNLVLIGKECEIDDPLHMAPNNVTNLIDYAPTPLGEEWRADFLLDLINLRKHNLDLDWEDNVQLS